MRRIIAIYFVLAVGSLAARAEAVHQMQAPGFDFSKLHSYAFAWEIYPDEYRNHPVADGGAPVDPAVERGVDRVLQGKGFERISSGDPDFLVNCTGFVKDELLVEGSHLEIAQGLTWVGEGPRSARRAQVAMHRIEIIDFQSAEVVWSGWDVQVARDELARRKKLEKWTRKIIRNFPPG